MEISHGAIRSYDLYRKLALGALVTIKQKAKEIVNLEPPPHTEHTLKVYITRHIKTGAYVMSDI